MFFPKSGEGERPGLMSGFALASVLGVPFGLFLGTRLGWHVPFLLLAALGIPILAVAALTLPRLRASGTEIGQRASVARRGRYVHSAQPCAHLRLVVSLMFAGFVVFPYVSPYLVSNVGMAEDQLPLIFVVGGIVTLFSAPLIGRLADRYGKLRVFRIVALPLWP